MIKLLIFDIGGVIIDFKEEQYIHALAKKQKLNEKKLTKVLMPLIDKMEVRAITLKEAEKIVGSEFNISTYSLHWDEIYIHIARLNHKVKNLFNRLSKEYKVVLLSNVSESRFKLMLEMFGDQLHYDRVFTSCYLKMSKPNAKIYKYVLKKMNTKPSEALFIDDRVINVQGARKAHLHAIQFRGIKKLRKDLKRLNVIE